MAWIFPKAENIKNNTYEPYVNNSANKTTWYNIRIVYKCESMV